jgi:sugar lactone lactonase YvrE
MRHATKLCTVLTSFVLAFPCLAKADNGSYSYAGGSFSTGTSVGQNISVQASTLSASQATLSFTCPITSFGAGTYAWNWSCAGGTVTIASSDKSLVFTGTFISAKMTLTGSGGGRGGHTSYAYQFTGSMSGAITAGGVTQAIIGSLSQDVTTRQQIGTASAPVTGGSFGWNSAYAPLLFGDSYNGRILRADNITGTGLVTYGASGSGTGQFMAIGGLAQDAEKRIYITDPILNRLVRIDSLNGTNWVELGSTGSAHGQFNRPLGVAIDASGKIWVADSGNDRIVRFDDMTGKNWTTFGTAGSGVNQFTTPSAIAFDATSRIYVTDEGNNRLVRIDNLTGTNWTTLTELILDPYGYLIDAPTGVAVNAAGQIYVAAYDYLVQSNDMTGTSGGSVSYWSGPLFGFSLDQSGTAYLSGNFTPGFAQVINAAGAGYFGSNLNGLITSPGAILAMKSTSPPPAAGLLSVKSLTFAKQNVGEPSAAQQVQLTNIGGTPLTISSVTTDADFPISNGCTAPLSGGASCTVGVRFDPTVTGFRKTHLAVAASGAHPLLEVGLYGIGTAPTAIVSPGTLSFDPQKTGTSSGPQLATLTNTGSGPLTISSISATGDFSQTSNCGKSLVAGNGCTIQVAFKPTTTGTRSGALTISDDAIPTGTHQTISLAGSGTASVSVLSLSPESLLFPGQAVGSASHFQTVTLTNNSAAKVSFGSRAYSAGFKEASTTCGSTLAAGASCAVHLVFAPTKPGPITGTLTIPVTGKPSLTVALDGTGMAGGSPAALLVKPGGINFGQVTIGDQGYITATVSNSTGLPVGIQSITFSGSSGLSFYGNTCGPILTGYGSCKFSMSLVPHSTPAFYTGTVTLIESSGAQTPVSVSGEGVTDSGGGY